MRGGLRRHVVPLAVALATAILLVVPGASAAPPRGPILSGRPGGGRPGARRRRRRRRVPPVRRHPDRGADRRHRRARVRRGRPRLPDRQRPAVPRLLRPDVGPLPLEDVAGRRQPRVRDRRRTRLLRLLRRHRPAPGARAGTPTTSARGGSTSSTPTATIVRCGPGSAQGRWLRADLAAHPRACVAAIWHHPLFSSGEHGEQRQVAARCGRRWRPPAPTSCSTATTTTTSGSRPRPPTVTRSAGGIREFVVGTGGAPLRGFGRVAANSVARSAAAHGVLKLTLGAGGYTWAFVPVAGQDLRGRRIRRLPLTATAPDQRRRRRTSPRLSAINSTPRPSSPSRRTSRRNVTVRITTVMNATTRLSRRNRIRTSRLKKASMAR